MSTHKALVDRLSQMRHRNRLKKLSHFIAPINGGGEVYVLDRGSVINAEDEAMLQALHSRSTGGFLEHLEKLGETGAGRFMERFYVGYGHKSIGDCGDTTLFIEGVSMPVAKAIQDSPLYSGQEASTRYVDFSKQRFVDPTNSMMGNDILESQRDFYLSVLDPIRKHLMELHPKQDGEKNSVYEGAINARSFDIARGFLPAGASTNLAWHSSLRQIADRLPFLMAHPMREVRYTADAIDSVVREMHPHSFFDKEFKNDDERRKHEERERLAEQYQQLVAQNYFYLDENAPEFRVTANVNDDELSKYRSLFDKRPMKSEVPKFLSQVGDISAEFLLDFGSFRDINRHRPINQRMPLVTTRLGFNDWYLQNLPPGELQRAQDHLGKLEGRIVNLGVSPEDAQYFVPMGYNTSNKIKGDLPNMVYMVELRDSSLVHPTARAVAKNIGDVIEDSFKIPLYRDKDSGRFNVKRGEQDIVDLKNGEVLKR